MITSGDLGGWFVVVSLCVAAAVFRLDSEGSAQPCRNAPFLLPLPALGDGLANPGVGAMILRSFIPLFTGDPPLFPAAFWGCSESFARVCISRPPSRPVRGELSSEGLINGLKKSATTMPPPPGGPAGAKAPESPERPSIPATSKEDPNAPSSSSSSSASRSGRATVEKFPTDRSGRPSPRKGSPPRGLPVAYHGEEEPFDDGDGRRPPPPKFAVEPFVPRYCAAKADVLFHR
mmetsp:Transcript_11099/g.23286  ORF Transcript_11099/g.23286 Transcript_11099/m.23286 type:complete len:233 (+) Transcript_11099:331-1029(+)